MTDKTRELTSYGYIDSHTDGWISLSDAQWLLVHITYIYH